MVVWCNQGHWGRGYITAHFANGRFVFWKSLRS